MTYKHILVAVDLTESSKEVIDKATSLAKGANCKLSLVYVDVDDVVLESRHRVALESKMQAMVDQSDYPITESLVVIGDLHIKLAGIVKKSNIDLVVCGHHHTFFSRLFSSVPKLANAVETDLLVVYLNQ
ncbi:universal stress protein [Photobacterium rosenbergii]|uniref:Universal stress protein n=1 Tax=Photobacterium rosenbergii TaxID=294936 RepID=A0ABU3ZDD8_9GAMM|nr:universal stress protein [Photobacterium rosenbergii]MDV5168135.1 universal stress protein [Photobacterium rosenbergii]